MSNQRTRYKRHALAEDRVDRLRQIGGCEGTSLMNARDIDRLTAAIADVDSEDRLERLPRRSELITPFVEREPLV